MDFLIGLLGVIFALPLLTGYAAHSYKRSFWLWFVLAMVLPIISWILLIILIWRSERNAIQMQEQQEISEAILTAEEV